MCKYTKQNHCSTSDLIKSCRILYINWYLNYITVSSTAENLNYRFLHMILVDETQKRRDFYAAHPESKPSGLETRAEASYQHLLTPDEMLCISLMYNGAADKCTPRYLRCSASLSIWHLQKLIRNKYDLSVHHRVEILHQDEALAAYLTLMDVAYIYLWRRVSYSQ